MAIETREKLIGQHRYKVTQLGAKQGRGLLVRLTKLAGPGIGAFVGGLGARKSADTDSAIAMGISQALYDLATRITEDEVGAILDDLAKNTVIVLGDREPRLSDIFDGHFAGRYDEMIKWAAFCLEVNYHSFFAGSGGSSGLWSRLQMLLSASPSPSTSTGTSTASPAARGTPQA